jgi:hypothetical protein
MVVAAAVVAVDCYYNLESLPLFDMKKVGNRRR